MIEALRLAWAVGPRLLIAAALEGLAALVTQPSQASLTIQLVGAASALREQIGTPMRPVDQRALKNVLATADQLSAMMPSQ